MNTETYQSGENFLIKQFQVSFLSQLSYYIESKNENALIYPIRIDTIVYFLLTHYHADFVVGQLNLVKIIEASNHTQAFTQYQFKIVKVLNLQKSQELLPIKSSCFVLEVDGKDHAGQIFSFSCIQIFRFYYSPNFIISQFYLRNIVIKLNDDVFLKIE